MDLTAFPVFTEDLPEDKRIDQKIKMIPTDEREDGPSISGLLPRRARTANDTDE